MSIEVSVKLLKEQVFRELHFMMSVQHTVAYK